ncbi:band 7 [Chlorella sorokiniana]|uniref:Band 7 n=1 Tax=Chlorella sorokiniana TaxID=3076 RepID=A0A2P6U388_CHLSO|nr:band 7 [Chlorella sorokiniana]|eukprot:PRW60776.1 band 7 [Chlorella sorokiniana]
MARRSGRAHQLVCLLLALAVGARARPQVARQPRVDPPKPEVLSEDLLQDLFSITAAEGNGSSSTPALAVPDGGWLACGRSTPCEDPKACCAIWGVCGSGDRFCGQNCLSGACTNPPPAGPSPSPQPSPSPSPPSPPAVPSPSPSPAAQPSPSPAAPVPSPPAGPPPTFVDATVSVAEGEILLAACDYPGWVISRVDDAAWGNPDSGCNSTTTYLIATAACLRESACMLPAVSQVFDDPCPGQYKQLSLSFRCEPEDVLPPLPEPSPSPPPADPGNPFPSTALPFATAAQWGRSGELFSAADGPLSDWSQAGYSGNADFIPDYEATLDVKDFGAKGDGKTDDTQAFLAAISNASDLATASGKGATVSVPPGQYRITRQLTIDTSRVVLRGAGPAQTTLQFPYPLSQIYGTGQAWAYGGSWLTILGSNPSSSATENYLASLTADARRGDTVIQADLPDVIQPGDWVRLWAKTPFNTQRPEGTGRALLAAAGGKKQGVAPAGKVAATSVQAKQPGEASVASLLFDDADLQAGVAAALEADVAAQRAAKKVTAQSLDAANGTDTNPLDLPPTLLLAGRYAATALLAELAAAEAPADPSPGTLDDYLFGAGVLAAPEGSEEEVSEPDLIRFVAKVTAVGKGWVELDRALPYDLRLEWQPEVHAFAPSVWLSGFEGFTLEFPWSAYRSNLEVDGYNGVGLYEAVNCWVRDVRIVNADVGVLVAGSDFVTVTGLVLATSEPRGIQAAEGLAGHIGVRAQQSSNVLITDLVAYDTWLHDASLTVYTESSVLANSRGLDLSIDTEGSHHNLVSSVSVGRGNRAFQGVSGASTAWWNVFSPGGDLALPSCDFGTGLFFAGRFTNATKGPSSSTGTGTRRLLAKQQAGAAQQAQQAQQRVQKQDLEEDQMRKDADVGRDPQGGKYGTESAEAMSAYQQPKPQAHTSLPEVVEAAQRLGEQAAQQGPNKAGQDDAIPKHADIGRDPQGGQYGTEAALSMSAAQKGGG